MLNNYNRVLDLLSGFQVRVDVPGAEAGLQTLSKKNQLELTFAVRLDDQVHQAKLLVASAVGGEIKLLDLSGTQALVDSKTPNPLSGRGVSTFLINTLLQTLGEVLPASTRIFGRLEAPQAADLEPLAARRNFWRRFGFEIENWGRGKELVTGQLGELSLYPESLLGSHPQKGMDLMHLHLIGTATQLD
ncbi:hypothetical protein SAMN05660443_0010 [Marinospirillum celere]|uniref:Uncharacterized protein n=1 Tax=Marinospirillum celere TaxID=1122252 RepID=A0A1I1JUE5_9GAMM|nr:hypothetical protein [Marinospirillum celere]SFC52136.1 hypothetical protein SAMN05660443_0010 [Marinospirillum celere]